MALRSPESSSDILAIKKFAEDSTRRFLGNQMALCKCGCGQETRLAPWTDKSKGWRKGKPLDFAWGHNASWIKAKKCLYKEKMCGFSSPCWIWSLSIKSSGYGQIVRNSPITGKRKHYQAHRYMYELKVGKIPKGMDIDHLCRNRSCVNPDHLQAVPGRINYQRAGWRAHGKCCPTCQRPF